jgi:hypothetical protein
MPNDDRAMKKRRPARSMRTMLRAVVATLKDGQRRRSLSRVGIENGSKASSVPAHHRLRTTQKIARLTCAAITMTPPKFASSTPAG